MTRNDKAPREPVNLITVRGCAREICDRAERILKQLDELDGPMSELNRQMQRCAPQSEEERNILAVSRRLTGRGQLCVLALDAQDLAGWCDCALPARQPATAAAPAGLQEVPA